MSSHITIDCLTNVRNFRLPGSLHRADVDGIRTLIGFLVTDCCDGHPELCDLQATISEAKRGCAPAKGKSQRALA
jgi:hypothetical protein